ncbi:hypothetical protein AGMMS49938_11870 [Fibrobacterales bacterium]|nr:hypothetical protein AGMMS49938_11870 [Fibrobacterales bacterium]
MTIEEMRQLFADRDAKYEREQVARDARMEALSAKYAREQDERDAKYAREQAERDARMEVFTAEYKREQAERDARLDSVTKGLEKKTLDLEKNNLIMGNLTNKIGSLVESVVVPGIVEKFNEKGFHFDSVSADVKILKKMGTAI